MSKSPEAAKNECLLREKFALPNLDTQVSEGTGEAVSIADYFNTMLDQSMD